MRRILSAILLAGLLVPTFVGIFPTPVEASLLDSYNDLTTRQNILLQTLATEPTAANIQILGELDDQIFAALQDVTDRLGSFISPNQQSQMRGLLNNYREQREQWRELLPQTIEACRDAGGISSPVANLLCLNSQRQLQNLADAGVASQNEISDLTQNLLLGIDTSQTTPEQDQELQEIFDFYREREEDVEATSQRLENYKQSYSACSSWIDFQLGECLLDVVGWAFDIFTSLGTFILFFAQNFFNYVIEVSIVDFKSLIDPDIESSNIQRGGLAVKTLWGVFRDLANLTFIFMLLYIAGATILQATSVDTKKTVTWLIVVALLVNFSAVFTRIAIDASNVMALVFYDRFKSEEGTKPNIAGQFIQSSRIADLFGLPAPESQSNSVLGKIAKGFGTLILTLVISWVLIISAGFFLIRMIAFILLIIVSPLAFAGYSIPWLKSQVTDKWNKELKKQCVFAPVFMALLYMVATLAKGIKDIEFTGSGSSNAIGYVIIYAMLIGLMVAALQLARSSADGVASSKMSSWGGWAARGASGIAGRNVLGRAANGLGKSEAVQRLVARTPILGRTLQTGLNKAADYGYGTKTNFRQATDARVKTHTTAMANMNETQKASYIARLVTTGDQLNAYNALSEKDKVKVELEVAKPELAWARNSINFNDLKKQLKGEKKEGLDKNIETEKAKSIRKTAYALEEGQDKKTDREKYQKLGELLLQESNEKERETIYNGLTDMERAAIVAYADSTQKPKLEELARKLTGEKYEKYGEQFKKLKNVEALGDLEKYLEDNSKSDNDIIPILEKIGSQGVASLGDDKLKEEKIIRNLSGTDLAAIFKVYTSTSNNDGSLISTETFEDIRTKINQMGTNEARAYIGNNAAKKILDNLGPKGRTRPGQDNPNPGGQPSGNRNPKDIDFNDGSWSDALSNKNALERELRLLSIQPNTSKVKVTRGVGDEIQGTYVGIDTNGSILVRNDTTGTNESIRPGEIFRFGKI